MTATPGTALDNPFRRPVHLSTICGIARCRHPYAQGTFSIPDLPGWLVTVTLHSDGKFIAISDFRVTFDSAGAAEPGQSLTGQQLRKVPLGLLMRMVRDSARFNVSDDEATAVQLEQELGIPRPPSWTSEPPEPRMEWAVPTVGDQRTGRKGHSDTELAKVAYDYVQLLGRPKPVERLADESGLTTGAIKSRLEKCRDRNLLTRPESRGLAGGALTKKALRLLDLE